MDCILTETEPGKFTCATCDQPPVVAADNRIHRKCVRYATIKSIGRYGAGTELTKLLKSLGFAEHPKCECKRHARTMNRMGVEWCADNLETIVGWLKKEATKQGLLFMFSEFATRQLVLLAIRRARRTMAASRA